MKVAPRYYILGYDPGGNHRHGVAVLEVARTAFKRWQPTELMLKLCQTVDQVTDHVEAIIGNEGKLVASGIDTLTAWSTGNSGWRPADERLRRHYKAVARSVDNANHINGSMCLNGALVLRWLSQRRDKGGVVTEVHPKVCFFALYQERHPWANATESDDGQKRAGKATLPPADKEAAKRWLLEELGLSRMMDFASEDHLFDAALGCLAALKGLNREWSTDLHHEDNLVHPFVSTHYWWPEDIPRLSPPSLTVVRAMVRSKL